MEYFLSLNPTLQAFLASLFTLIMTISGSSLVFFTKKLSKNKVNLINGFSSGIMLSALIFSLLNPALESGKIITILIGFIIGSLFIFFTDKLITYYDKTAGLKKIFSMILAITIHNIPEGLVIGIAFSSNPKAAIGIALAIGIQNFPEGSAVSIPLRKKGMPILKAFIIGCLCGFVEPISACLGTFIYNPSIMPLLLSFAAGTMFYVVINEMIPESMEDKNKELITMFTIFGFLFMMVLDVCL